jgi:signal transduction histidine kinase
MVERSSADPSRLATADEIKHALKVNPASALLGFILFCMACALAFWLFEPIVPILRLIYWSNGTAAILLVWLCLTIAIVFRKPSTRELIQVWAPAAKFVLLGADCIVVASIWLFLPFADQATAMAMMIIYTAHLPVQILCSPENTEINRFGIVSVLGSLLAFLLLHNVPHAKPIAIFFCSFAVLLYFVSDVIRRSVRDAVSARLVSDATARKLEVALVEVATERDAKTRFIASASHDLGQPLQAASLFFDQAIRATDELAKSKAIVGVQRSFAAADQLLSHMLNHLRLEADAVEPQVSLIDLAHSFERLKAQHLPLADQLGITIRIAPCSFALMLDPSLFDRAMSNLLSNALTHSGAKKVLIGCRSLANERLRIYLLDNGVGIGAADAKHIFNDFYRGSDSIAHSKIGFGLGLSTVKRVAEVMGGRAGFDERWLHGAAFYLEFPRFPLTRNIDGHMPNL